MKNILLAALLALSLAPADAASVTVPNGAISIVIVNAAGTVIAQPSATIDNPTETLFAAWCGAHYSGTALAGTTVGCIGVWFDDWINQTKANMLAVSVAAAQATAAAAVVSPVITPAQ